MTNFALERHKPETGVRLTSQETVKGKFISKRGNEFTIDRQSNGLFSIKMRARGIPPKFCSDKFTSYGQAQDILIKYLSKHDPLRLAVYPGHIKGRYGSAKGKK